MNKTDPSSGSRAGGIASAPFYVWLLALYPVLFTAAANPGQAPARSVLIACAFVLGGATVAYVVCRPIMRSWMKAGLLAAAFVALFFAYGHFHGAIEEAALTRVERGARLFALDALHLKLSAAAALILVAAALGIARMSPKAVRETGKALNFVALVLVGIVSSKLSSAIVPESRPERDTSADGVSTPHTAAQTPDIYYIIMDGYARADILREYYDFDNRDFLDALEARGFTINHASAANYNWTFLSLGSSLNFRYLDDVLGGLPPPSQTDRSLVYERIRDNAAARFLRARGYEFVHMQSTWGATRNNPYANLQLRCHVGLATDEFLRAIAEVSWIKVFNPRTTFDLAECHSRNFSTLATVGKAPGPKFVFAHFLLPHHPYLFDAEGNVLRNANLSNQFNLHARLWEKKDLYLGQLQYVNRRIIETIDGILASSAKPPVIILQSDHGPNLHVGVSRDERIRIRLANFAAYHLPGAGPDLIPEGGSPVNQFRRVFSFYFDANLPLLPDRHFFSPFNRPFNMTEIENLPLGPRDDAVIMAAARDAP